MSAPTVAQLKAEILTDPAGLGYLAKLNTNDPEGAALLINAVNPLITVKRPDIGSAELLEAIDSRDFPATPDWRQSWFESATQQTRLRLINDDGTNTRVLGNLKRILGDTNLTQTRLTALAVRTGSRAEQLWGAGVIVSGTDMAIALAS